MKNKEGLALPKGNLKLIAVGMVIIVVGFLCMIGGGSEDGVSFNPDIYSSRNITVGPLISVFGFFFVIYAILRNPKGKEVPGSGLTVRNNDEMVTKYENDITIKEGKSSEVIKVD